MTNPYLAAGAPPDAVAWAALVIACIALVLAVTRRRRVERLFASLGTTPLLFALAALAAALSAGYIVYYLRGGPRIVDATSYFLEARAFANGYFSFPVPSPSGSFRGRFLITPTGESSLSVIFPPGYPAVLAIGQLLRVPLAVGPVLAAAVVLGTYFLARALSFREEVARVAALLSVVCVALRYHTADTMAHGLCALLFCTSLAAAARGGGRFGALSGFSLGLLVATRPVSALVALALVLVVFARRDNVFQIIAFALPGIALLFVHQHAATGHWLNSTQLRYYALADGPPGCFRYGFGQGIGCTFEHGDFVRARLADGYGFSEALGNTLRRLAVHALDIANAAPFAAVALYAAFRGRREKSVRVLVLGILGLSLAYAPFYFEASYPGGGARLLADVLPLEHVLVAFGLSELKLARFALPTALAGFALHTSYAHRLLAEREGSRPMFEARILEAANIDRGLLFVTTDHGFNLAHRPGKLDPKTDLVVARLRNDAHDYLLWQSLGRPPTYVYRFDVRGEQAPRVEAYLPTKTLRLEAEAQWPLLEMPHGFAHPDFVPCASLGRGLRLRGEHGKVALEIGSPAPGTYDLHVGWALPGRAADFRSSLELVCTSTHQVTTAYAQAPRESECFETVFPAQELAHPTERVLLSTPTPNAILDYISLHKVGIPP